MSTPDYPALIRDARVYDVAIRTPLELATNLSRRFGNRILMKREDLQPVFSFKLRGAYNKIAHLSDAAIGWRRNLQLGGQPCAGGGPGGQPTRRARCDRHAGHDAQRSRPMRSRALGA